MSAEKTVVNMSLLLWCFVVIIEIIILVYLANSGLILLGGIILIPPITAAFSWPATEEIEHDGTKNTEAKTEKAEQ